jgi:hypothetical protein
MSKINVGLRLPEALVGRLKKEAIAKHRSVSGQAEHILNEALPDGEKIEYNPETHESRWLRPRSNTGFDSLQGQKDCGGSQIYNTTDIN